MLFDSDLANIAIPAVVLFSLCCCFLFFCIEKFCFPFIYPEIEPECEIAHVTAPAQPMRPVAQIPAELPPDGVPVHAVLAVIGGAINNNPMASAPSFSLLGSSIMMDRSNSLRSNALSANSFTSNQYFSV